MNADLVDRGEIGEAIDGARFILLVTPAVAHETYAQLLKGRVSADQLVVLYPGAFGSLLFRKLFEGDECPVFAEVNNLPYDTRLTGACEVSIYGYNKVGIAFMPAEAEALWEADVRSFIPSTASMRTSWRRA